MSRLEDDFANDGHGTTPKGIHTMLTRTMYRRYGSCNPRSSRSNALFRRSKMNPLWNTLLVAGLQDGAPFLGFVDKIGVAYEETAIATGFGLHIALVCSRDVHIRSAHCLCSP